MISLFKRNGIIGYVVLFSSIINAEWVQTNGPVGNYIISFAVIDSTIFSTTLDGVFYSDQKGSKWNEIRYDFRQRPSAIESNDGKLFIGTNGAGVFRSVDKGVTWTQANNGLTIEYVNSLFAAGDSMVFVGIKYGGIFRSTNDGDNWEAADSSMKKIQVNSFSIQDELLFAGTDSGVYVSENNGMNWINKNSDLPKTRILCLVIKDSTIFAGTDGGVYVSNTTITHWTAVDSGLKKTSIVSLIAEGETIVAGSNNKQVYFISKTDNHWIIHKTELPYGYVCVLKKCGNGIFAGTSGAGIFLSTNNGAQWTPVNNGFYCSTEINFLELNGSTIFAGTSAAGLFYSNDDGDNWLPVANGLTDITYKSFTRYDSTIIVGTDNSGIFLSTDNGTAWKPINTGLSETAFIPALAANDSAIFASTSNGLFIYKRNDTKWFRSGSVPTSEYIWDIIAFKNNVYVGSDGSGIFVSSDNGLNWTSMNDGLSDKDVNKLAFCDSTMIAGTYSGIFRFNNSEDKWIKTGLGKTIQAVATKGDTIVAGTYVNGIYISANKGESWSIYNKGLMNYSIYSLLIKDDLIFAGTAGSGVWKRPLLEITDIKNTDSPSEITKEIPFQNSHIDKVYPDIIVSFELLKPVTMSMNMYNLSGKVIASKASDHMNPGPHSWHIDRRTITAGCYILRLTADNNIHRNQIVLIH